MAAEGIAIVGAGVAGAATAIRLAERGIAVTLYEAVAKPKPIGAGLLLQPTGQRVLAAMGLLDEVFWRWTRGWTGCLATRPPAARCWT
jgi:2-polyprenyl-6-methoxyphenol hydroxylase-like FAD-dependent oxidoreductase